MVFLRNDAGLVKQVKVGFAWTAFFFQGFPYFFRGMPARGGIYLAGLYLAIAMVWGLSKIELVVLAEVIGLIVSITLGVLMNKQTAVHYLESGYKPIGKGWDVATAKWNLPLSSQPTGGGSVKEATSALDELERLAALLDRGDLTEEEFLRKKKELLNRPPAYETSTQPPCKSCGHVLRPIMTTDLKEVAKSALSCQCCMWKQLRQLEIELMVLLTNGLIWAVLFVSIIYIVVQFVQCCPLVWHLPGISSSSSSPRSSAPSVDAQLPAVAAQRPAAEVEFIRIVSEAQVKARQAANDMQKGGIKAERDKAICGLMKTKSVWNWMGTVATIDANSDGKGVLAVQIADNIFVQTWNNVVSDMGEHTLLEPGSAIFTAASAMKRGQEVTFSGSFKNDVDGECVEEQGATLDDKLSKPKFTMSFREIAPPALKKEDKKALDFVEVIHRDPDQLCAELGKFDFKAFQEKYNIPDEKLDESYGIWSIVEEASRGGRFGKPDPELVLSLLCQNHGDESLAGSAENIGAVSEAYTNWKNGTVKEFNICAHITSGFGGGFCARRAYNKDEKERESKLTELRQRLGQKSHNLLYDAYKSAEKFIELKTQEEEGSGGSGYAGFVLDSQTEQKNEYLQVIMGICDGYTPSPKNAFSKSDKQLNETYQKVLKALDGAPPKGYEMPSSDDVRAVQRLWVTYRDVSVKLFMAINPSVGENVYKSWLTEVRSKKLKDYWWRNE